MFKRLRVKNFRTIEDSGDLDFSNLNIILGPNNSGKSSLIYPLLIMKQTIEDSNPEKALVTSGTHVNVGGYSDFIRDHDQNNDFSLGIDFDDVALNSLDELSPFKFSGNPFLGSLLSKLLFSLSNDPDSYKTFFKSFSLGFLSGEHLSGIYNNKTWTLSGSNDDLLKYFTPTFRNFIPTIEIIREKIDPKDTELFQKIMMHYIKFNMMDSASTLVFNSLRYVAPIREWIPRFEVTSTVPYSELGPSGKNLLYVLSHIKLTHNDKTPILNELNKWLGRKFGITSNIRLEDIDENKIIKSLIADDPKGSSNINLAYMGSGVAQITPVVVQTILTPKHGSIIIEQPEVHLHPKAQCDLGDLFISYAKKKRQIIIETHSEHLVLRIRRRIAEGKLDPELVRIFVVDKYHGKARIKSLELNKKGHFTKWPLNFFDQSYKEAMAIAESQYKAK